jgi:hypothetical protein
MKRCKICGREGDDLVWSRVEGYADGTSRETEHVCWSHMREAIETDPVRKQAWDRFWRHILDTMPSDSQPL